MKNSQNGFVGIALIILIAVVAIGGGTYIYIHKGGSEVSAVQDVSNENSAEIENKISAKKTSSPITTSPTTVTATVTTKTNPVSAPMVATGQNCGSILDRRILLEADKRTVEETKSLGCLSEAILSCSSAYLTITGEYTGKYQVFNKTGNNCIISSTNGDMVQKCEVPIKLIFSLQEYSIEKKEPIENLVVPISFAMAFEGGKDIRTGEEFKLSCQKY